MNFKFSISCSIIILFFSCTNKPSESDQGVNKITFYDLEGGIKLSISEDINRSSDIMIVGKNLIVGDKDDEFYFKIFDLETDSFLSSLGKIGDGPCEIGFPTFIQSVPNNDSLLGLILKSKFGYQEVSMTSSLPDQKNCQNEMQMIDFNFMNYIKVSDSLFFGTGIFQKKYAIWKEGQDGFEELPIDFPYFPKEVRSVPGHVPMSQQGKFSVKPDGKKIIFTHLTNVFFDILTIEQERIVLSRRMEGPAPIYQGSDNPNQISAMMSEENIFGFISSSVTDKAIYLLYSGKSRSDGDTQISNQIKVYDWEGNEISNLKLDQEVNQIAVSPDSKFLITYHDDGKANLTKYELHENL